eukprot:1498864-Pyramimonas_sp.AAC.1
MTRLLSLVFACSPHGTYSSLTGQQPLTARGIHLAQGPGHLIAFEVAPGECSQILQALRSELSAFFQHETLQLRGESNVLAFCLEKLRVPA